MVAVTEKVKLVRFKIACNSSILANCWCSRPNGPIRVQCHKRRIVSLASWESYNFCLHLVLQFENRTFELHLPFENCSEFHCKGMDNFRRGLTTFLSGGAGAKTCLAVGLDESKQKTS
jgi:hypothetical protein